VKYHLQQQIAKLFFEVRYITGLIGFLDRVKRLICFLQQIL